MPKLRKKPSSSGPGPSNPKWEAGFFDGEGHVCITSPCGRHSYSLRCGISNTRQDVLSDLCWQHGGIVQRLRPRTNKQKAGYAWTTSGPTAAKFLRRMLPHLRLKKPQAKLGLQFQATMQVDMARTSIPRSVMGVRNRLWQKLKRLNRKG